MSRYDKYFRLEFGLYAIGWLMVFCIPFATQAYDVLSGFSTSFKVGESIKTFELILPIFIFFLLNNFVLLPKLFFKKHVAAYLLALIVLYVILWVIQEPPGPRHPMPEGWKDMHRPGPDMFHITNLIIEICVTFANFAIKVYIHSLRRDVVMLQVKNENMKSELGSLKYQISPHFLMNTLNNIQSLIEINPKGAYETIQYLSRMMRYLLYDNNTSTVPLKREIDFINDFIKVMKLRFTDNVQISVNFPDDTKDIKIPPLLFIAFVENAFKHGVSSCGNSFISINMELEQDSLMFRCMNSVNGRTNLSKATSGIGIENVRRRLDLIYGQEYTLTITPVEESYMVQLVIPINYKNV